jgi:hypothetical protein
LRASLECGGSTPLWFFDLAIKGESGVKPPHAKEARNISDPYVGVASVFRAKMTCFFDDDDYVRQVQNRKSRRLAILR